MHISCVFLLGLLQTLVVSAAPQEAATADCPLQESQSEHDFPWQLFAHVRDVQAENDPDKNIFVSPASIKLVMGMLREGARTTSQEAVESALMCHASCGCDMNKFMTNSVKQLDTQNSEDLTLDSANRIYVDKRFTLNPTYQEELTSTYQADAVTSEFETNPDPERKKINAWVKEKTQGHIKELFNEGAITTDTAMAIVNAIYFKAQWQSKFNPEFTKQKNFRTFSGKEIPTDFMLETAKFPIAYSETLKTQLLSLAYIDGAEDSNTTFNILLPTDEGEKALQALESGLTHANIAELEENLNEIEVSVALPKFEMDYELDLEKVFNKLGMEELFTDRADFSGMLEDGPELKISSAIHKTHVKVDEEGTEAAAATGVGMVAMSLPPVFRCDRPFLFYLKRNDEILFLGKFAAPAQEE